MYLPSSSFQNYGAINKDLEKKTTTAVLDKDDVKISVATTSELS